MDDAPPPRLPRPEEVKEALGFVPLVEAYFRRAQTEMPDELREIFRGHRLTARHGAVLPQLTVETSLSVSELAGRMGMSLTTASELLGDLSRAGLVERREDPANRRRTLVSLAPRHRAMIEGFVALRAAPLLRVLDELSPVERQGFVAGLVAWAHEVRNW
ncbi:MarR family winged helix-turn-helix transcriptional regulator [[Actinomadura] parvosata]|uniref:MarR family transcriptional regulator n=2 Tax=Nonomuraea TaxID=83681 RepID=A0A1V0AJ85_9ACTN|nr:MULTISPECIES: MarR family transcriptional regulator [unclassified Nonomuraea]AQZ70281.1 MarR family transcriptional regulator [Nonomuraea sp. ATCC 55076]NJP96088.1 winged helix DNA-binding protein [Nonomuraea sp. FMUSA5-5]